MSALGLDLSPCVSALPAFPAQGKGATGETVYALAFTNATAGGSGDNTEVDGVTVDTNGAPAQATGLQFVVPAKATLADGKTLVVTANLQDSANGTDWTDITTPATILTLTGGTGGSTETGTGMLACDLAVARRYVRIQATPNLNATNTDTATIGGIAAYGLADDAAATEVNGDTIDLTTLAVRANSVAFQVSAKAVLSSEETLTVTANLQDSANGSSWTDITDPAVILTLTGDESTGSTETGVGELGYNLSLCRRYIRIQMTPTLSSPTTDNAVISGLAVFGGLNSR